MNSIEKANETSNYLLLVLAIIVGIVGVYFRFIHDSMMFSLISWIILVVGVIIALKAVFKILQ
ncbi:hypothetical protein GCM10027037_18520 [Mucilaginibacter koreensis]